MKTLWHKLPAWLQSIIWFLVLLYPVVLLNQTLIQVNVYTLSEFPWALALVLLSLWGFWQFTTGATYPFGVSEHRRRLSSIDMPSNNSKAIPLLLSLSLLLFVYSVNAIGFGLFDTDQTAQLQFIQFVGSAPTWTGPLLLLAAALTAGIVEEIVFRGYMQKILTEAYGPWISFFLVATLFAIGHLLPIELIIPYMLVSIAFSWVAHTIDSVIPGILVHILFDFMAFMLILYNLPVSQPDYLFELIPINIVLVILSAAGLYYFGNNIGQKEANMKSKESII